MRTSSGVSCAFWLSLNSSRVWLSAFGNRVARVLSTAARVWAVFAPSAKSTKMNASPFTLKSRDKRSLGTTIPPPSSEKSPASSRPLIVYVTCSPVGVVSTSLSPTFLPLPTPLLVSTTTPSSPSWPKRRGGAFLPVRLVQRGGGAGVDADDGRRAGVALHLRRGEAHGGDVVDARDVADGGRRLLGDRREPVLVDDDEVAGGERPVDGACRSNRAGRRRRSPRTRRAPRRS